MSPTAGFGFADLVMCLDPVGFGMVAPLFVLPVTWLVHAFRNERGDIFIALFVVVFVAFTITFANLGLATNSVR